MIKLSNAHKVVISTVRFSGCATMYKKCRLHSSENSKSSYDVTDSLQKIK